MDVRRQRPADGQAIRAGLLLRDTPLPRPPVLRLQQVVDERRPHDASLDIDDALGAIERAHAIEARHVEHQRTLRRIAGRPSRGGRRRC